MTERQDEAPALAATTEPEPARRSRGQRFSPSMGWKAFWSEILIVVSGVAIALGASEAVQEWNWRNKVADAEVRLAQDAALLYGWSAEQYVVKPCVDAQLDRLARNLMDSEATLSPVPMHEDASSPALPRFVLRQPTRPWRFSVWDTLEADGTATHFTQTRQHLFGYLNETAASLLLHRNDISRLGGQSDGAVLSLAAERQCASGIPGDDRDPALAKHVARALELAVDGALEAGRPRIVGGSCRCQPGSLRNGEVLQGARVAVGGLAQGAGSVPQCEHTGKPASTTMTGQPEGRTA